MMVVLQRSDFQDTNLAKCALSDVIYAKELYISQQDKDFFLQSI